MAQKEGENNAELLHFNNPESVASSGSVRFRHSDPDSFEGVFLLLEVPYLTGQVYVRKIKGILITVGLDRVERKEQVVRRSRKPDGEDSSYT